MGDLNLNSAARILEAAKRGDQYESLLTGQPVSASILARYKYETPLNQLEADAFEWIEANEEFMNLLMDFVNELRDSGRHRFGFQSIIERARWEWTVVLRGDEFRINDHLKPYLARLINELIESPFFTARAVAGEPGSDEWECQDAA